MSVSSADMTDVAVALMDKGDHLITASPTVKEAEVAKDNFASSVTVRVKNYLEVPLVAVRANPRAGEIEIPINDVLSLTESALLCYRITRPPSKSGCAGTASYKIGDTKQYLHIMWSSPNNFDKHASHLAVGVSQEVGDKFNDMYYNRPTWFTRKYVYHDTKGLWFHSEDLVIHASNQTRPVSEVEVCVFPSSVDKLPKPVQQALGI